MNTRYFELNRNRVRVLLQILLGIAALLLSFFILLGNAWRKDEDAAQAAGSKTAIALMTGALLGPSPTAPTPTPSNLPTMTSTITMATPSATRPLTETATRPAFVSATPRDREPRPTRTSTIGYP